jgi:RimK family alpha-L-glutamate ligase
MKISVVARDQGWYTNELKKEAARSKTDLNIVNFRNLNNAKEINKLGEVVIWRSSSVNRGVERTTLLNCLKDKQIVNESLIKYPFLPYKLFQQKSLLKNSTVNTIPTYTFKNKGELLAALKDGTLSFPFIQKPNLGSKGEGISLIKTLKNIEGQSIDYSGYIYQNFIKNTGDYRALVLGGKLLGVMKRTAKKGSFLNNISKGGRASLVSDTETLKSVGDIAITVSSLFNLTFCGIDVIFDQKIKKYYFLEINTAPQWKGFQKTTGINVAREIIGLCLALGNRKINSTLVCVEDYYWKNIFYLFDKKFHFTSRLFLWDRDKKAEREIKKMRKAYLGLNRKELIKKTEKILADGKNSPIDKILNKELREKYFKKYPQLLAYNRILFKNLFVGTIYNESLRPVIDKIIPRKKFIDLKTKIEKDKRAIAILSTHAINYFYLLEYFLDKRKGVAYAINPSLYFDIAKKYAQSKTIKHVDLPLYLITHCIIGESQFYSRKITRHHDLYLEMIKFAESIILNNYFSVSLDNKFEFLVCSELCQYDSNLKDLIFSEADRSFSPSGNFLIDKHNDYKQKNSVKNGFLQAEHRNVLYMMANRNFTQNK